MAQWTRTNKSAMLAADTRVLNGPDGAPPNVALAEWLFPRPDTIYAPSGLAKSLGSNGAMSFHGDDSFLPLIQPETDPFEAAGVHDAIEALRSPEIGVDGATMVIEPTRALVAVDVNTRADFSPAAGLKTNLAVARELPRQLRLRGLGGQVVVDFAPMPKQHRRKLDEVLKSAFRTDPIETALVGWTSSAYMRFSANANAAPCTRCFDGLPNLQRADRPHIPPLLLPPLR